MYHLLWYVLVIEAIIDLTFILWVISANIKNTSKYESVEMLLNVGRHSAKYMLPTT